MENDDDALDLLLSLQSDDPIVESPRPMPEVDGTGATMLSTIKACSQTVAPSLPNASSAPLTDPDAGYYSDESYERPKWNVTMVAFRDVVKNTLEKTNSSTVVNINRPNPMVKSLPCNQVDVDQHSGLRIRERLVPSATLNSRFCNLKFVGWYGRQLQGRVGDCGSVD